jgi:methionyl-tRNA formyltransferase
MAFPILFAGTAEIGVPLLQALANDERFDLRQVITNPDRPAGRKMQLMPSPIKQTALELNLPVLQPENINTPESLESLKKLDPVAIVVFAYGQLFKKELLELPSKGCLNIHTSLLPQYRGASPIQSALLNQDETTGISLMQMVKKMDAGAVFSITEVKIEPTDNSLTLTEKLAQKSAEVIPDHLHRVLTHALQPTPQEEEKATYCQKISKVDGLIDWTEPATTIDAKLRAFYGWPGTYTHFESKRLKIIRAIPHSAQSDHEPGTVYRSDGKTLIQTGQGSLEPVEVQPEGKKKQSLTEFLNGNVEFIGKKLS